MRSLHLELRPIIWMNLERTRSALTCTRLLRLCGPTLESLTWVDAFENSHSLNTFTTEDLISRFPRLQKLKLAFMKFADWSMLDMLIHDSLRTLDVDTEKDHVSSSFFQQRGTVRSLETFVWSSSHMPDDHNLEFLRANPQLTKLSIPSIQSKVLLDTRLLSLLSKSFKTLKPLSNNHWKGVSISNEALELISTLETLEQLHISAGE